MSFLSAIYSTNVLNYWNISTLGGKKNGSKAILKLCYFFYLDTWISSAFHFHVHSSVSRQFSFPSAIRSRVSENDCSLRWLLSQKEKRILCPTLLFGLSTSFSFHLKAQSFVLKGCGCPLFVSRGRAMKGVCSSSTRTHFWLKELQRETQKICVTYRLTGLNILGIHVSLLIFCKRKGESFYSFPSEVPVDKYRDICKTARLRLYFLWLL